jgi:hypothetical protein
MTKHPLTDEICDQIQDSVHPCDPADMRAAADWQLEQVIEWIKECPNYDLDFHSECRRMIADLKKAMRPQENNS